MFKLNVNGHIFCFQQLKSEIKSLKELNEIEVEKGNMNVNRISWFLYII